MHVIKLRFFVVRSLNEYWVRTCDACVMTTWRLGLRAPLVARTDVVTISLHHSSCPKFRTNSLLLEL